MDFSYLISISDGDKEFIAQFISTFKTNTTNILAAMEKSFSEKDFESLRKHAHQLKPSLEMLKLDSHETCLNIQDYPSKTTIDHINLIKDSCLVAVTKMNEEFSVNG